MLDYDALYEILRKEKYSEALQPLPKNFMEEFREYVKEKKEIPSSESNPLSDQVIKSKKQLENAVSIFREIMLKRKKKILGLVFIATETGIMKRDYENMLQIERETFDSLVKTFEKEDKEISSILNNKENKRESNKMILFKQDTEKFIDHEGYAIGPFKSGELANLDSNVADILVTGGKAIFVDET